MIASTVDTALLYLRKPDDFQYVVAIDDSNGGDGIVAKKDIKSVADLKGKNVAFSEGSVSEFYLNVLLAKAGLDPAIRAKNLDEQQMAQIVHAIQDGKYVIEGDLRREIGMNLKRLQGIKCYRGMRHLRSLPVRGQRTQTNARTRKGPRRTVGVQRNPNAKTGIH